MVQIKILLDKRRLKSDGTYPVIFRITDFKKAHTIPTGISIEERLWDEGNR